MTSQLVAFASPPPRDLLERLPTEETLVIAGTPPPDGFAWQPLDELLAPANLDEALALLKKLNALCDAAGTPYRGVVRYHAYEPWWFHQQTALDEYLLPFVRYRPLLASWRSAARVILVDCPPDLRRLLPLIRIPGRVELHDPATRPNESPRLRRIASATYYRLATARALARALIRRPGALVYGIDAIDRDGRNRWLDGLHHALENRGASFLEILWSGSGARASRQARVRRRAVVFWQAVAVHARVPARRRETDADASAGDLTGRFLHELAERVLLPAARASTRSVRRLERLLRVVRPGGVYLMDDYVHAFELVVACKRRGIPTVALQHGQFSRYTAGLMGYGFDGGVDQSFDRYCVWSAFFSQILERHSRLVPPGSLVVAGSPRARAAARARGERVALRPGRAPSVLFLSEHYDAAAQEREVSPYLRALADAGLEVWIKPHPATTQVPAVVPGGAAGNEPRVIASPLEELLGRADVVVASFSSAIFDAIFHARPVVLFATSRYRDPHGLAEAGLASLATSPGEIAERVTAAAALPARELERRRDRVWGAGSSGAGDVAVLEMDGLRQAGARSGRAAGSRPTRPAG